MNKIECCISCVDDVKTLDTKNLRLPTGVLFFSEKQYNLFPRLVNQRLLEVQSQVEELQKSLQDQGSKAEDVSRNVQQTYMEVVTLFKTFNFL